MSQWPYTMLGAAALLFTMASVSACDASGESGGSGTQSGSGNGSIAEGADSSEASEAASGQASTQTSAAEDLGSEAGSDTDGPSDSESSASDTGASCPGMGDVGVAQGQIIVDISVRRCDGSDVSLYELACGQKLTLIDIGGAGFADCVQATDEYATSPEYDELQAQGLQIVQIFDSDTMLQLPTLRFCQEYSEAHQVDFEFLIDQLGAVKDLAPLHPVNILLDGDARILHFWIGDIPDTKLEIIRGLLADAD